jgi:hypothetical protein
MTIRNPLRVSAQQLPVFLRQRLQITNILRLPASHAASSSGLSWWIIPPSRVALRAQPGPRRQDHQGTRRMSCIAVHFCASKAFTCSSIALTSTGRANSKATRMSVRQW